MEKELALNAVPPDVRSGKAVVVTQEPEYTDEQFELDILKAKKPLEALANKARRNLKDGIARKFPE